MSQPLGSHGRDRQHAPDAVRRWLVLAVVSIAFLTVELDITIVNVALPSIQTDLGFSRSDLHWVVNAYLLFFGGFVLLTGRLADLYGRKPMFVAGVAVFGVGSILSAVAPSATTLVIGRALQGLGGAALAPTGMSLIMTTFTDARERTRALGVWTFILTGSVAVGLTLGGVITEALSWRWIFAINAPIVAVLLVLALRVLPSTSRAAGHGFDIAGAALSTSGAATVIYALANVPEQGWTSSQTLGLLATGALILVAFVLVELRSAAPLIRLGIFNVRFVTVGDVSFLLTSSAMFGTYFFGTLYLQQALGYGPLKAGIALLPLAAGIIAGVSASEPLSHRIGAQATAVIGLTIGAGGALVLSGITADSVYSWPFFPGLLLSSIGIGMSIVALTYLATSGVPSEDAGLASGLYTAASYLGGALGLAVLSTVAAARTEHALSTSADSELDALVRGYSLAYVVAAILMAIAAALVMGFLRHAPTGVSQVSDSKS